jgi:hypothetical protein
MGWSNYMLVKKDKIALECSRSFESACYIDNHESDLLDKFNKFVEDNTDSDLEDEPIKGLSIGKVNKMWTAFELLRQYDDETVFYLLLKARYGEVEVVHENKVPEDYTKIRREFS